MRIEADRAPERRRCRCETVRTGERSSTKLQPSQLVVGGAVLRIELERPPYGRLGVVAPSGGAGHHRVRQVRLSLVWRDLDCSLGDGQRLLASELEEHRNAASVT